MSNRTATLSVLSIFTMVLLAFTPFAARGQEGEESSEEIIARQEYMTNLRAGGPGRTLPPDAYAGMVAQPTPQESPPPVQPVVERIAVEKPNVTDAHGHGAVPHPSRQAQRSSGTSTPPMASTSSRPLCRQFRNRSGSVTAAGSMLIPMQHTPLWDTSAAITAQPGSGPKGNIRWIRAPAM